MSNEAFTLIEVYQAFVFFFGPVFQIKVENYFL